MEISYTQVNKIPSVTLVIAYEDMERHLKTLYQLVEHKDMQQMGKGTRPSFPFTF